MVISPRSSLIGETLGSSVLEQRFEIDVLELDYSSSRQNLAIAAKELAAGDILIVRGTRDDLLKIAR